MLLRWISLESTLVNLLVISSTDRNHHHDKPLINHLVNQTIAHIAQLDLVGVLQVSAQSSGRHVRFLHSLRQNLLKLQLNGAV